MKRVQGRDKRIEYQLRKIYPNGEVRQLYKMSGLYQEIKNYCNEIGIDYINYIESLGFTYIRRTKKFTLDKIVEDIKLLFPIKKLRGISELQEKDINLYQNLRNVAISRNVTPGELLEQQGFKIIHRSNSNIEFDINALKKLKKEFGCNFSDIARILGVSRQNLDQKLKVKRTYPNYWQGKLLSENEQYILNEMINKHKYVYDTEQLRIRIYKHQKNTSEFSILVKNDREIKCFLKYPNK